MNSVFRFCPRSSPPRPSEHVRTGTTQTFARFSIRSRPVLVFLRWGRESPAPPRKLQSSSCAPSSSKQSGSDSSTRLFTVQHIFHRQNVRTYTCAMAARGALDTFGCKLPAAFAEGTNLWGVSLGVVDGCRERKKALDSVPLLGDVRLQQGWPEGWQWGGRNPAVGGCLCLFGWWSYFRDTANCQFCCSCWKRLLLLTTAVTFIVATATAAANRKTGMMINGSSFQPVFLGDRDKSCRNDKCLNINSGNSCMIMKDRLISGAIATSFCGLGHCLGLSLPSSSPYPQTWHRSDSGSFRVKGCGWKRGGSSPR